MVQGKKSEILSLTANISGGTGSGEQTQSTLSSFGTSSLACTVLQILFCLSQRSSYLQAREKVLVVILKCILIVFNPSVTMTTHMVTSKRRKSSKQLRNLAALRK